jgi:hypothetical protein
MAQPERIYAECPRCGAVSEAWAVGTPDLDVDPELADPGRLQAEASHTCPACGCTACCSGLAAERELFLRR